jgi:hypothetical protein
MHERSSAVFLRVCGLAPPEMQGYFGWAFTALH